MHTDRVNAMAYRLSRRQREELGRSRRAPTRSGRSLLGCINKWIGQCETAACRTGVIQGCIEVEGPFADDQSAGPRLGVGVSSHGIRPIGVGRRGPTLAKASSLFTRKGRSWGRRRARPMDPRSCRADCATKGGGAQWKYDLCIAGCKAMESMPF